MLYLDSGPLSVRAAVMMMPATGVIVGVSGVVAMIVLAANVHPRSGRLHEQEHARQSDRYEGTVLVHSLCHWAVFSLKPQESSTKLLGI